MLPDDDGYPTDEELTRIREWLVRDPLGWFAFIKTCWWAADWGWTEFDGLDDGIPAHVYLISTGGWSGNEQIVQVMRENTILWALSWESVRRGGHYEFRVRRERTSLSQQFLRFRAEMEAQQTLLRIKSACFASTGKEVEELKAEVERLTQENKECAEIIELYREASRKAEAVVQAAETIFQSSSRGTLRNGVLVKQPCPHGNAPTYPTHAWWCDDCWGALEKTLAGYRGGGTG